MLYLRQNPYPVFLNLKLPVILRSVLITCISSLKVKNFLHLRYLSVYCLYHCLHKETLHGSFTVY